MKFPIFLFRVKGNSMYPTIKAGQLGVAFSWAYIFSKPAVGDIVIASLDHPYPNRKIIKRIYKITKENIWLRGDNLYCGEHNKCFIPAKKTNILGKVICFTLC